ncbi:undecaprenyl/decaprenyl-phosphate alpha-N-acetylglucosaminyl 1-phosphate transferase [Rhodocytophaga rosea]|uniref:Undecaprenyl/decaprenyl-phosphate alpha-N-acetylglucosaminyl 1-phosphate transferase n=1 Tax=Rhodocytophaga rosea TaxID=2704465 RepID=A0A6C0GD00_9BACT|nr:MraY family glycosyltransferase [Rhodocytophaga rosea]QHT65758.1 undecaprenyl/decaprenyl-phosphate alpha-N-acetylglucosaminyl 1-phosphate transferase [Rhodocytophaga rosea]
MLSILTSFLTSFIITYTAIPMVLRVAQIRKIFDEPDERKIHKKTIPALGGVAMFSGLFFSIMFWSQPELFINLRWVILSLVIMFLLGLKDDIVSINPYKKLIGQIVAAMLVVVWGDIRLNSLHGLFGIYELIPAIDIVLSIFVMIVIVNAFNLIDGIDGLAGGIGVIASLVFGGMFLISNEPLLALISFSLTGALLAFLRYNFSPASIFMGDGGSLVTGFILAILCIRFININENLISETSHFPAPAIALAILIVPLADTLRVFIIRIMNKKSPFSADRNHIHHLLLNLRLNHKKAALTLYLMNILFIFMSFAFFHIGVNFLFFLVVVTAFIMSQIPYIILQNKKSEKKENGVLNLFWKR